ncbi:efflux RND transporter periplasmic adaptor subunit [Seohaeicola nanhaiensis]|uniref:Efflux RND transporter periplasmic adaptor subunit n=1 Tax=Seohaeicola nanhaiensis TaxID=1387282 RepID=A0ABV9KDC7_9RHOB
MAKYVPAAAPWLQKAGVYKVLSMEPPGKTTSGGGPAGGGTPRAAVAVVAVRVELEQLTDQVAAIGDGRAYRSVSVRSDVAGRVAEVLITSGEAVSEGDVLVRLDDAAERIALEKARLTLADAEDELTRVRTLSQTGAATGVRRQSAELAEKAALLGVDQAEFELSQKVIRAPIGGWVGLLDIEVGDRISNQDVLAVLADRSRILVDFRVPERLTSQVRPGVAFEAEPLAMRGHTLTGQIVAVDNVIDRASRTLRVQGEIANADDTLRSGMAFSVRMAFDGPVLPSVPALAVQWTSEGAFVWAVREDKVRRVPVSILRRTADRALVDGALSEGDLIVVEGVQNLRPGIEVVTQQAQSTATADPLRPEASL